MHRAAAVLAVSSVLAVCAAAPARAQIGDERALPDHLADGDEYKLPLKKLIHHGKKVFTAKWTVQDGFGRPQSKGTGVALSDPTDPLVFPRNMNRISGPDSNSCADCHNTPAVGGGGGFVANVFVLGQRFDFATFDDVPDGFTTKGTTDESGKLVNLQEIANPRATIGMFGSGYVEMLARQMTERLQQIRDGLAPGQSAPLVAKGISFGTLTRNMDGSFDTSQVEGLPPASTDASSGPPSLIVRPFHQVGAVVSLREFTNGAMNHHHGIQSTERFGADVDPDGDGVENELTRADMTACVLFQATLPVPVRVIPNDPAVEQAVRAGEKLFVSIGCADCHVPCLPLTDKGWVYSEPNPYNPPGNLQPGDVPSPLFVDLNNKKKLPRPRLKAKQGVTWVPAFTDLKIHDITSGPSDPNREALDQHAPAGSPEFFQGNGRFLTKKLWGCASEPPYFHHGKFTTLREAIEAHAGEAAASKAAWDGLTAPEQDAVIEFLKTLRIVPGAKHLVIDEKGKKKKWPPFPYDCSKHLTE